MAGVKEVVVRAQALDSTWQVIGSDGARGVYPEDVVLEADAWGPSKASFNLRRNPARTWPDIRAFTPIEIDIGGVTVWDGFVDDTPSRVTDRIINVQCLGWQYHLDDDVYEQGYVHNDLTAWKDYRSLLTSTLGAGAGAANAQINVGEAGIVLAWPKGYTTVGGEFAGVVLDLGPGSAGRAASVVVESSQNFSAASSLYLMLHDSPNSQDGIGREDILSNLFNGTAPAAYYEGTTASPHRYVTLLHFVNTGGQTLGGDVWFRIKALSVYGSASYKNSGASILKASDVALDALAKGTVLLSPDRSGVQPTSFNIPTFWPTEPITPRQAWERVDAYHDWVKQIAVGRRAIYKPKPSAPIIEVGNWSAMTDEDASANSGDEIYNRALITGQTPDGQPVRAYRGAGQLAGQVSEGIASPSADNPSFDTNTASWTATLSTITRDTAVFDTGPASGRWDNGGAVPPINAQLVETFTGLFRGGTTYTLTLMWRLTGGTQPLIAVRLGASVGLDAGVDFNGPTGAVFAQTSIKWTPKDDTTTAVFSLQMFGNTAVGPIYIDSLRLARAVPTLVDRRGFRRTKVLPISNTLPSDGAAANALGNTWLPGHKTTPFKGTTSAVGNGAARDILTGEDVPPERLLLKTMELVRFNDRPDPDTGGHGRDGRMVGVRYIHSEDRAEPTIDNSRQSFEALLARYGVLAG